MPGYVRVRQTATGHHVTVPTEHYEAAPKGAYELLKQDATNAGGTPLPPKYRTTVSTEAAKSGQTAGNQKEKD